MSILDDESAAPFLTQGIFRFKTLEEARSVAIFLAQACPEPRIVIVALTEVFINAIEHGNLGITTAEKNQLQHNMQWLPEIERRLKLRENKDKYVTVEYKRGPKEIEIQVTDQGKGFNWQSYQDFDPSDKLSTHGRGLAMTKNLAFSRLEYSEQGNRVSCFISLR